MNGDPLKEHLNCEESSLVKQKSLPATLTRPQYANYVLGGDPGIILLFPDYMLQALALMAGQKHLQPAHTVISQKLILVFIRS